MIEELEKEVEESNENSELVKTEGIEKEKEAQRPGIKEPNEPAKICYFCKKPIGAGIAVHSTVDGFMWGGVPKNESAHLECYIENAVNSAVAKRVAQINLQMAQKKKEQSNA